ncbi:hypothetical protein ACLESD_02825 [Pyxidicoccus sp. 3LFB2]
MKRFVSFRILRRVVQTLTIILLLMKVTVFVYEHWDTISSWFTCGHVVFLTAASRWQASEAGTPASIVTPVDVPSRGQTGSAYAAGSCPRRALR